MSAAPILPDDEVAEIAARHGFEPDDPELAAEVEGARIAHGSIATGYDGDARRHWHVDPATGRVDAARLLDGNLGEQARVRDAECGSIGSFHNMAYGDD